MTVGPYSGDHKSADRILIGVVRASKVGNATTLTRIRQAVPVASQRRFWFPKARQRYKICITARGAARGRVVVLNNPGEQIRECLQHAEECAREAAKLPNSSPFRQDFLQLVKHWLELAGSIEFGEQLDSFTQNSAEPNHPNL
jgi:hypothetical protein